MLHNRVEAAAGMRTEESGSESVRERELLSLLNLSPQALGVFQDLQMVFANPAFLDLIGVSSLEEGKGDRPFQIFSPETAKMIRERHAARLRGENPIETYEVDYIRRNGMPGRMVVTGKVIEWGGRIANLVACNDITSTHVAAEAMRASEERYRHLVEDATQGMMIVQDNKIVFCNQACMEFMQADSPQQIVGREVTDFIIPDRRELMHQEHRAILSGSLSAATRLSEITLPNGSRIWIIFVMSRALWNGRPAIQIHGIDVTELRSAEQRLMQHSRILELLEEGVLVSDPFGRIEFCNPAAERILGYPHEQLIGSIVHELVPLLGEEQATSFFDTLRSTGHWEGEMPVMRHGKTLWLYVSMLRYHNPASDRLDHIAAFRDVTEQVRARESLQRQATALELTDDGVIFTDVAGAMMEANQAAVEIFGRPREDMLGRHAWTLFFREEREMEHLHPIIRQELEASGRWQDELGVRLENGRMATLAVTIVSTKAHHNQPSGRVVFVRDVTEWRRTQVSLRRQAVVMALMEESALITDEDGWVTDVNASSQRMFGYDRNEMIGMPVSAFLHDPAASVLPIVNVEAAMQADGRIVGETEARRKNGQSFLVSFNAVPFFDVGGAARGMIVISRDITRPRMQERERQKMMQELETKNSELEQFTYTVSHDLRSPLITIRGFIDLLAQDIAAGNGARVDSDLNRIRLASERMDQMLTELLRLSRIGRVLGTIEAASMRDIVLDALIAVTGAMQGRGIRVEIDDNLPVIECDRMRLVEVFQNLLDNAVKFMGDQAHPRITIGARPSAAGPIVFVQDNGVGIDPRYHAKIFGLFDTLASNAVGTGIGLAIVKRIVEKHGGKIWVESEGIGKGATFCMTFPENGVEA